jgi:hypothetical protein
MKVAELLPRNLSYNVEQVKLVVLEKMQTKLQVDQT